MLFIKSTQLWNTRVYLPNRSLVKKNVNKKKSLCKLNVKILNNKKFPKLNLILNKLSYRSICKISTVLRVTTNNLHLVLFNNLVKSFVIFIKIFSLRTNIKPQKIKTIRLNKTKNMLSYL